MEGQHSAATVNTKLQKNTTKEKRSKNMVQKYFKTKLGEKLDQAFSPNDFNRPWAIMPDGSVYVDRDEPLSVVGKWNRFVKTPNWRSGVYDTFGNKTRRHGDTYEKFCNDSYYKYVCIAQYVDPKTVKFDSLFHSPIPTLKGYLENPQDGLCKYTRNEIDTLTFTEITKELADYVVRKNPKVYHKDFVAVDIDNISCDNDSPRRYILHRYYGKYFFLGLVNPKVVTDEAIERLHNVYEGNVFAFNNTKSSFDIKVNIVSAPGPNWKSLYESRNKYAEDLEDEFKRQSKILGLKLEELDRSNDAIKELRFESVVKDKTINYLENAVKHKNNYIDSLKNKINLLNSQINSLKEDNNQLKQDNKLSDETILRLSKENCELRTLRSINNHPCL